MRHDLHCLIPGLDAFDQLLNRWNKAIGIKWVGSKAISPVPSKAQIVFGVAAVGDILQGFLNAKTAGIGFLAGGAGFVLGPV